MRLREGWYFASMQGARIECVWVRASRDYDQNREPGCPMMVESVGYADPMPANRFEFFGRVRLPSVARKQVRDAASERARDLLRRAHKDFRNSTGT